MRDVLFLNRRIDDDLSEFPLCHLLLAQCQADRFGQHLGTDSLTPLRQRCRMQRHFMLHHCEATEVLPVRVFHPAFQQGLVRFVEGVLQVMQAHQ